MNPPPGAPMLREALWGLSAPLVGTSLLVRNPSLWPVSLLPMGAGLLWSLLALLQYASGTLQGGFLGWIGFVFVASFAVLIVAVQVLIAVLSPLLDLLSEKTERIVGHEPLILSGTFLGRVLRALSEAGKLLVFKLVLGLAAFVVAMVPVVGFPLAVLMVGLVLALDFLDYPMARRLLPLAEKRRWLRVHSSAAVAFSLSCYAFLLVPGLGGLFLAPSVVGGTWLVCRTGFPSRPAGEPVASLLRPG